MSDDIAWGRFKQEALLEDGGKTEYRKDGLETQAQHRAVRSDSTYQVGRKQPTGSFNKYFDLGANKVMNSSLFCVNTQLLNLILRDASYGGRYYGSSGVVARELGIDLQSARKRIKAMEDDRLLFRMQSSTGSRYILMNPHYFCAGGQEDEDIAKRIWAKEEAKRLKEARKRGP